MQSVASAEEAAFAARAREIHLRHRSQTLADVDRLNRKYSQPVFGKMRVWDLLEKLGMAVDPTDKQLYGVSQWVHCLQVVERMEQDGCSEEFLIAGLVHDLGKVLLTTGERPEFVVCDNFAIGEYPEGAGLDNCVFQWNHDEFGYLRLKDHLPDHLARLVRYHSIHPSSLRYLSATDRWLYDNYLRPFRVYDKTTKSLFHLPEVDLERYRRLIDQWFPQEIEF